MITYPIGFHKGAEAASYSNTYSVDFDGVDDLIQTTGISGVTDPASVSLWLYPLTNGNFKGFFSSENAWSTTAANNFLIQNHQGNLRYLARDASSSYDLFLSTGTLSLDNWHHVAVTYNTSLVTKYYMDGSLVRSHTHNSALDVGTSSQYIYLGYGYWNSSAGNKAAIAHMSDIGIWDAKELNATEIKSIYNAKLIIR